MKALIEFLLVVAWSVCIMAVFDLEVTIFRLVAALSAYFIVSVHYGFLGGATRTTEYRRQIKHGIARTSPTKPTQIETRKMH
jgi:hypothetical protein